MDGIVNVNKPLGITSHDVVYRLRKILNIKKIGHTGTLDPDASGVLPMCIGKGTKLAEYLTASDKQYMARLQLGAFTDTQDASGEVLESFDVNVTENEICDAVNSFVGEISQIPPMFSAIKIEGKKLYELAREGKTVEREPRKVVINGIEIKNINLEDGTVDMLVDCSKGTYIRTLCNDIGAALGCGGHMSALERTRSGRFSISEAFSLEQIETMTEKGDYSFLTHVSEALPEYRRIVLGGRNAWRVRNGIKIKVEGLCDGETYRVFDEKNDFLALARKNGEDFEIIKSFYGGA
ncbi:MAG: tRNA pseudouridine(55) synthase TruB [Ruminococcaceae bacterium]|nr:tRNA pseudouridine(55) synthase TruB [Oscillospiraceae bacterium]